MKQLPPELELIPAAAVIRGWQWSEASVWRAEKRGELVPLRIGRRRFYRTSDLRVFLDNASKKPPIAVPWRARPKDAEP